MGKTRTVLIYTCRCASWGLYIPSQAVTRFSSSSAFERGYFYQLCEHERWKKIKKFVIFLFLFVFLWRPSDSLMLRCIEFGCFWHLKVHLLILFLCADVEVHICMCVETHATIAFIDIWFSFSFICTGMSDYREGVREIHGWSILEFCWCSSGDSISKIQYQLVISPQFKIFAIIIIITIWDFLSWYSEYSQTKDILGYSYLLLFFHADSSSSSCNSEKWGRCGC